MAQKYDMKYGIIQKTRLYTETTVCDLRFVMMIYDEYNNMIDRTFDDFLDDLYTKGDTYIVGKNFNLRVKVIIDEQDDEYYVE